MLISFNISQNDKRKKIIAQLKYRQAKGHHSQKDEQVNEVTRTQYWVSQIRAISLYCCEN